MKIIYQDEHFFAIDKPAGFFVHPPEASPFPPPPEKICLFQLRELMNRDVFPVHRLDAPTSGVVLFAMSKMATRELSRLFADRQIEKEYHAVARGFVAEEGQIQIPLEIAGFKDPSDATTNFSRIATIELPFAVGKKYPTARYSLVRVQPVTGRWHQIRRHFDRIAHPLLGDIEHGDSHHNRFFRDELKLSGLCLRAKSLAFTNPWTAKTVCIEAAPCAKWHGIYTLFHV